MAATIVKKLKKKKNGENVAEFIHLSAVLRCFVFFYLHSGVDILTGKDQMSFLHHVNLVTKKKEESIEKKGGAEVAQFSGADGSDDWLQAKVSGGRS